MSDKPVRVSATHMIVATNEEAARIRSTQRALVSAGIREAPDQAMIRRAEIFEETSRFVALMTPYAADIRVMIKKQPGQVARFLGGKNG